MDSTLNPTKSHLWAQVRKAEANHGCDLDGNFLRDSRYPANTKKVILGDIVEMILRTFGPHETPVFVTPPKFDEQNWTLLIQDSEIKVEVSSKPYWGFGLLGVCYLNEITITGPLPRRCRLVYDISAGLGRDAWSASRQKKFVSKSATTMAQHKANWQGHIDFFSEEMADVINKYASLVEKENGEELSFEGKELLLIASENIEIAEAALNDRNSLATERSLSRVEEALIQLKPSFQGERRTLLSADNSSLQEEGGILFSNEGRGGGYENDDTMVGREEVIDEVIDDIPFIDLTQKNEEE